MIFELAHEEITLALKEYMDARGILNGKDFTFLMKTSRKGEKTSRVIITTTDVKLTNVIPVPKAVESAQMELPFDDPEPVAEAEPEKTPFKKLFAAA